MVLVYYMPPENLTVWNNRCVVDDKVEGLQMSYIREHQMGLRGENKPDLEVFICSWWI